MIALLSDTQLMIERPRSRIDNIVETQMKKIGFVLDWVREQEGILVQAGDFMDVSRNWFLLEAYVRFFLKYQNVLPIYVVYGQHDTYMYSDKTRNATIVGVLEAAGIVHVLKETPILVHGVRLYGCSYGQPVPVPIKGSTPNVLVIHRMIVPHKLWADQTEYDYAPTFLAQNKGFDVILCGDCHVKFLFRDGKRFICNTGCMIRHIADEYNLTHKPCFFSYDPSRGLLESVILPHKPADVVLDRGELDRKQEYARGLTEFVSGIPSMDDGSEQEIDAVFKENLLLLLDQNKDKVTQGVVDILAETMDEEILWQEKRKERKLRSRKH